MLSKTIGYALLDELKEVKDGKIKMKEQIHHYDNFYEVMYVYKDEETMLKDRERMELEGYKAYTCGDKAWFIGDEIVDPNSHFFKHDVRIPTAVYGKEFKGLLSKLLERIQK